MMKEAAKEKALADELDTLNDDMNKQASASMVVDFVYQHQIDNLMAKLVEWEQRYETDTTEIEFELEKLKSSLDKLNDQTESLKKEIAVFRQRVDEAREKEREAQENARLLELSVSTIYIVILSIIFHFLFLFLYRAYPAKSIVYVRVAIVKRRKYQLTVQKQEYYKKNLYMGKNAGKNYKSSFSRYIRNKITFF